jgi:putative phage-type endonuclease
MKTHSLLQGSPEWLAYRAQHFNASDAPAMMGLSEYKTRTQLMHEMHTGMTPEVDAGTQRRFDDGHRFEALARPLAEAIIGQDLYPVVGSSGKLSASLDGLTMDETINFEHKTLNDHLRAIMVEGCNGADLDMQYQIQMEQQHLVSGADRTLFMASKWSGDELVEERHCWYETNLELRQQIAAGWEQFAIDLAAYSPVEVVAKAVGHTPETLPALRIEVTGMVTASNLAEYKAHALSVFSKINRELVTDQDFASAESTVKWCSEIETRLAAAKQHALSQTESIDLLFKTIDDISAEARATRLELDRLVKARKEQVRVDIVMDGAKAIASHIEALNMRLGRNYMPAVPADFAGAVKGKRTLESMRDAVATTLASAKIAASAIADKIDENLRHLSDVNAPMALFSDISTICLKASDDFQLLVKSRVDAEAERINAQAEKARAAIQEEERIKAEREANAKLADERAKAALAERDRIAEQVAFEKLERDEIARLAKLNTTMVVEVAPAVTHEAVAKIMMPATVRQAMAPKAETPPTLTLGEISTRLGFNCTSAFLATLGFEATTVKAAKLFHEGDFPAICKALIGHIAEVSEQFDAVAA